MNLGLQGRLAMVAAGSKGIGRAVAKTLVEEGCRVSICARGEEGLGQACEAIGGSVRGYVADVSKPEDLERWVAYTRAELGEPDILVTNTGGPAAGTVDAITDEQWVEGFHSTLLNVVRLTRLVAPGMCERGWGRIVHLTSLVAKEPADILAISSTLRSGLMALTRLQARTYGPHGVTVNGVLPGHTLTDRQVHLAEVRAARSGGTVEEALAANAALAAVGRLGRPEEIAATVAFLCSEQAAFVTGVNLPADGGALRGT